MQLEVMEHYGIIKYFRDADYFETEHQRRIFNQLKKVIPEGQLIALSGVVGSGKTTTLSRLQDLLAKEKKSHRCKIAVCREDKDQPWNADHRAVL